MLDEDCWFTCFKIGLVPIQHKATGIHSNAFYNVSENTGCDENYIFGSSCSVCFLFSVCSRVCRFIRPRWNTIEPWAAYLEQCTFWWISITSGIIWIQRWSDGDIKSFHWQLRNTFCLNVLWYSHLVIGFFGECSALFVSALIKKIFRMTEILHY